MDYVVENKPYCTCIRGAKDGYVQSPDGDWYVHVTCKRPAKLVYEKIVIPKMLAGGKNFEEILRRKQVFDARVQAREQVEIEMISQDLEVDIRLVRKIWEDRG